MGDRVDGGVGEHALSVSSALAKIVALGLPKKKDPHLGIQRRHASGLVSIWHHDMISWALQVNTLQKVSTNRP